MNRLPKIPVLDIEAALIMLGGGIFFGIMALFHELSVSFFCGGFFIGAYLFFACLPYFDPMKWKARPKLCGFLGMIGATVLGFALNYSLENLPLFGIFGAILGYFAPNWARYM